MFHFWVDYNKKKLKSIFGLQWSHNLGLALSQLEIMMIDYNFIKGRTKVLPYMVKNLVLVILLLHYWNVSYNLAP